MHPYSNRSHIYAFVISLLLSILTSSCHVGRYFTKNLADTKDAEFFPSTPISGNEVPRLISRGTDYQSSKMISYKNSEIPLSLFLSKTKSTSFLILKDGEIEYQWYADAYDSSSILPSFSVSKSVVSALVGIAIADGKISSLDASVGDYLGKDYDESMQSLSFRHLLDMRAGLNFRESYSSPFSPMAKYYYGRHLSRYVKKLKASQYPGSHYEYQSAATQLAAMALTNAVGGDFEKYMADHLWIPAGMGSGSYWNLDRKGGTNKFFCCLNATALDYARFGLLFAERGRNKDIQVIPESWVNDIFEGRNDSRDSQSYPYYLGWRQTPDGGIFAKGILGQYIYVNPEKNIVIVRTGKSSAKLDWGKVFMELSAKY